MSDKQPPVNPFDPGAWRDARDSYLDAWAKAMVDAVNSDQYAKATGAILDSYLTASSPFREVLEKSMLQGAGTAQHAVAARFHRAGRACHPHRNAARRHGRQARSSRSSRNRPSRHAATSHEEEAHLGEEVVDRIRRRRSMSVAETSCVQPGRGVRRDSPDLEQGPHAEGGDCPDAQRTRVDAQQGQALSVYAGGADRTAPSGSAAAGLCLDEPAVDHGSSARPQLRRVHGEARLRRLPARLGSAGAGRQAPVVRRLRARVPPARHQEDEGHHRYRGIQPPRMVHRLDHHDDLRGAAGRTRDSAISCSSPRRSISATRNR